MIKPYISIIVPIYNCEDVLRRCVDSIISQTFSNFELILVNDGSKDASGDICDSYSLLDRRVRAIHKVNGGVSSARNVGLDAATGEYIAFADADDYVEADWLNIFVSNLGDSDLCVQGKNVLRGQSNYKVFIANESEIRNDSSQSLISNLIKFRLLGYVCTKLFKRSIIETKRIRFNTDIHFREDDLFVVEYACNIGSFSIASECGYNYYQPSADKAYPSSSCEDVNVLMFQFLKNIFHDDIPSWICDRYIDTIEGDIVSNILNNRKPNQDLIDLYKYVANKSNNYTQAIKKKIVYSVLIRSRARYFVSRKIISFVHKLMERI